MNIFYTIRNIIVKLINKIRGVEYITPLVTNIEPDAGIGVRMMDDAKDSDASGSVNSKSETFMDNYISQIVDLMLDPNDLAKMANVPYYVISGSGPAWYYTPKSRIFSKVNRGSEVWLASKHTDDQGRYYVYANELIVLVPKEDLIRIDFN